MDPVSLTRRIVFVGAGPRVIALVDRIGAYLRTHTAAPLSLVLVDPHPAGAGRVWRTEQSRALLNNTSAADTTVFCDDTIRSAAPIEGGPSLHEWCRGAGARHPDPRVRAEATRMQPWSKPPRGLQGEYYRWALAEVEARHAAVLRIEQRRARVERVDLRPRPAVVLDDGARLEADAVVLSMGFVDDAPAEEEREWARFAAQHRLAYRAPGMIDRLDPHRLDFREPVLVRGLGATFFDLLGLIEESSADRLPARLLAGSAAGLPKRAQPDAPAPVLPPTRLNAQVIESWLDAHAGRGSADPALLWELVHAELEQAFLTYAEKLSADVPGTERFDWAAVADPRWDGTTPFDQSIEAFFQQESVTTETPHLSPWAAVRQRVLELRPRVLGLIQQGAFSASAEEEIHNRFLRPAGRLTSGPPAQRQRLLRRWHDAGRVHLIGPRARFAAAASSFVADSPARTGVVFDARQLVEARQSFGSVAHSSSPVVQSLLREGFAEPATTGDGFRVNPVDHRLRRQNGDASVPCWVAGHLARSTQKGVHQGAIPRSADPFLQEADVIAGSIVESLRAS